MEIRAGIYPQMVFSGGEAAAEVHRQDLQKIMLDAMPDCMKIISADGRLLTINKAGREALGIPENARLGMPWLPLLAPECLAPGSEALAKAAAGRTARFSGQSVSPSGVMHWDNVLTPLLDESARVMGIVCVSRDITETILLERGLEAALEREKLLAREMHHRIKNQFAVITGLISVAEREAAATGGVESATALLRGKLGALSRAFDAAFAERPDATGDDDPIEFAALAASVLGPYGRRCRLVESKALIRRAAVTTFALFLHELATNSVKYGALSNDDGAVALEWTVEGQTLGFSWVETGGPRLSVDRPRQGFGTEMIDRMARSVGGEIRRSWAPEGLIVDVQYPGSVYA